MTGNIKNVQKIVKNHEKIGRKKIESFTENGGNNHRKSNKNTKNGREIEKNHTKSTDLNTPGKKRFRHVVYDNAY